MAELSISAYIAAVKQGRINYSFKVTNYQKIGRGGVFIYKLRLILLDYYIGIMESYGYTQGIGVGSSYPPNTGAAGAGIPVDIYEDRNSRISITQSDMLICITHINNILGTNYSGKFTSS